jgi:hypothetical protein
MEERILHADHEDRSVVCELLQGGSLELQGEKSGLFGVFLSCGPWVLNLYDERGVLSACPLILCRRVSPANLFYRISPWQTIFNGAFTTPFYNTNGIPFTQSIYASDVLSSLEARLLRSLKELGRWI